MFQSDNTTIHCTYLVHYIMYIKNDISVPILHTVISEYVDSINYEFYGGHFVGVAENSPHATTGNQLHRAPP